MSIAKILNSTNGQNNVLLMVLFAVGAYFGLGEEAIGGVFIAFSALVMWINEIRKGERKGKFSGNVVAYILSAIVAAFPFASGAVEALEPITALFFSGEGLNIGALIGLAIPLINELIFLFREKPWIEGPTQ